ncbi:unnamed protein product [Ceratitis capitata]|uniref:(Mediterranean fruit fly) hypothetical protein n=1 Tax=Ceratitis capitata TaxID=7213 RepID=A0A811UQV1_CERCA|nr:unnamed protein product [Ceratitis capitata]
MAKFCKVHSDILRNLPHTLYNLRTFQPSLILAMKCSKILKYVRNHISSTLLPSFSPCYCRTNDFYICSYIKLLNIRHIRSFPQTTKRKLYVLNQNVSGVCTKV